MNKVITINLDGNAYQLEEGGYEVLRAYLDNATARLQGNPDKDEIFSDIERAIAEKFRALLGSNKTVVVTKEVAAVVAEMGPIEGEPGTTAPGAPPNSPGQEAKKEDQGSTPGARPRRLYRIYEGAMISGVCNGLAVYMNIDPTLVRLAFVFLTMLWGFGVVVYIVMAIVVPQAVSPEEKAAASGGPSTAQEFIRRAKAGYYDAMKNFPDRAARREWKRKFAQEMRGNAYQWRRSWRSCWAEQAPVHPGIGFTLPLLSLLQGAATLLWICATVSLLSNGTVFGRDLPGNVPVWVAAVLLFIAYGILTAPLKAARHACYWGSGQAKWGATFIILLDAIVWVAVVGALVCLAIHYFPELREAARGFPALAHQAADDIHNWWRGR